MQNMFVIAASFLIGSIIPLPFVGGATPGIAELAGTKDDATCDCQSIATCDVTYDDESSCQGQPCVFANIVTTEEGEPGKCFIPTVCPSDAKPCEHPSYSVTIDIASCSDLCCSTNRGDPEGVGCYTMKKNGTPVGVRCAEETIIVPLPAPGSHVCDANGDVIDTIKVYCKTNLVLEITATFRCGDCAAGEQE